MVDLNLNDFRPISSWNDEIGGRLWLNPEVGPMYTEVGPMYTIDESTSRKYLNQRAQVLVIKNFLLVLGSPIAQIYFLSAKSLYLIRDLFINLLCCNVASLKNRIWQVSRNVGVLVSMPLIYVLLELSALYGLVRPFDGRKLYASFERLAGDFDYLAPCFQPEPERHLFGGAIDARDAF